MGVEGFFLTGSLRVSPLVREGAGLVDDAVEGLWGVGVYVMPRPLQVVHTDVAPGSEVVGPVPGGGVKPRPGPVEHGHGDRRGEVLNAVQYGSLGPHYGQGHVGKRRLTTAYTNNRTYHNGRNNEWNE